MYTFFQTYRFVLCLFSVCCFGIALLNHMHYLMHPAVTLLKQRKVTVTDFKVHRNNLITLIVITALLVSAVLCFFGAA